MGKGHRGVSVQRWPLWPLWPSSSWLSPRLLRRTLVVLLVPEPPGGGRGGLVAVWGAFCHATNGSVRDRYPQRVARKTGHQNKCCTMSDLCLYFYMLCFNWGNYRICTLVFFFFQFLAIQNITKISLFTNNTDVALQNILRAVIIKCVCVCLGNDLICILVFVFLEFIFQNILKK